MERNYPEKSEEPQSAELTTADAVLPQPAICGDAGEGGDCVTRDESLYDGNASPASAPAVNDSPLIFFSLEDARKLVAERDRLLRQYEEVNRKVQAISVLVPDNMREKIFGNRSHVGSASANATSHAGANGVVIHAAPAPSLDDSIVEMLDDCLEVMSQDQIEESVWEIPAFSDKNKYPVEDIARSLEKVARRGRITKRGLNYASKQIAQDGRLLHSGPTIVDATERVLRSANESLEAWEVINRLRDDVDVGERVKQKPNGVYAALSRLTSRRIAYRDTDGGYRIGAK